MSKQLTEQEVAELRPIVAQVAIGLKRKFPILDREDLAQEAWLWATTNAKGVRELFALDDERERERLLVYRMSLAVKKWAQTEKARISGYKADDLYYYGKGELELILTQVFDDQAWVDAPETQADWTKYTGDPAVGGNRLATLADVSRACEKLSLEDKGLLRQYYHEGYTQRELAALWSCDHTTIGRHLDRALERLHEELGGERPDSIKEYTGGRTRMSTAAMNAEMENYG